MKDSLREKLNSLIRFRGYVPYEEIVRFTLEEGYKISNAERRLRHSESPNVEPVIGVSKRGGEYIKGYSWVDEKKISDANGNWIGMSTKMVIPFDAIGQFAPKETKNLITISGKTVPIREENKENKVEKGLF